MIVVRLALRSEWGRVVVVVVNSLSGTRRRSQRHPSASGTSGEDPSMGLHWGRY